MNIIEILASPLSRKVESVLMMMMAFSIGYYWGSFPKRNCQCQIKKLKEED
jgi:hypothetical protein